MVQEGSLMRSAVLTATIAICALFLPVLFVFAQNAMGNGIVDDADGAWTWSGMVPYSDTGLSHGTGHAGGPGAYGIYTFNGTGVDVYAMRATTVDVDGHV